MSGDCLSNAAVGVLGEDGVEDRVGDLVGDLVRVPLGHGLGGEQVLVVVERRHGVAVSGGGMAAVGGRAHGG